MYIKVQKSLYEVLKSILLRHHKLKGDLKNHSFKINTSDSCMANKIVNGYKMTAMWLMSDIKLSHKVSWEITKYAKWLVGIHGDIQMKQGKIHE